ncbi:recombinase family protein [Nonomuraea guangzhouensis]|uniref:Recombinase family protein n=1 Tax=Nonomuraea guangzhouensis TaxID=1291555 RepID=A0ABW4G9G6_9ACTN|nr:recombinase family protein [Nonomuraea guangzhouensis]
MAESEREYIREKSLEGQASARERGRHGGRPKVFDDDMIAYAQSLRARGVAVPDIARKLVIPSGKNRASTPRWPACTGRSPTARAATIATSVPPPPCDKWVFRQS